MCLIVRKGTVSQILENDLIVFKELSLATGSLRSMYNGFVYNPGKLYKTNIAKSAIFAPYDEQVFNNVDSILHEFGINWGSDKVLSILESYGPGFHFATTVERLSLSGKLGVTCKCIIPAGSEVIFDETGLGVTDQIIVTMIINDCNYK